MGKTRDLFKKIRESKGIFHVKMDTKRDRRYKDLTEAEEIKRWQEYMEELYKKGLNESDYYNGVVSHPEPNILECEIKRALESTAIIKPVDVMEFQ